METKKTRAEYRAERLAEIAEEKKRLEAEETAEKQLLDDMATKGLARSRAMVALYEALGIDVMRRDADEEKRAAEVVKRVKEGAKRVHDKGYEEGYNAGAASLWDAIAERLHRDRDGAAAWLRGED